jgi:hypothetical protein
MPAWWEVGLYYLFWFGVPILALTALVALTYAVCRGAYRNRKHGPDLPQ